MIFTHQVYLEVDGKKDLTLYLAYHAGDTTPDTFEIEVIKSDETIGKARWSLDVAHYALLFDPSVTVAHPSSPAISKCLGQAVGNGLLAGLWEAEGDLTQIRKNMRERAVGVLFEAAGRIAGCL